MSEELNDNVELDTPVDAPVAEPVEELVAEPAVEPAVEPVAEPAPHVVVEAVEEKPVDAITTDSLARSSSDTAQGLGSVTNGVIGVAQTPKAGKAKKAAPAPKKKADTVAIHSSRNVTWNGVGKVYIGYNIVDKQAADKWLTRSHCRLATPEEVAKEFGK